MKKRNFLKKISGLLVLTLAFTTLLYSCSNILQNNSVLKKASKPADGKTYLVVRAENSAESRTIPIENFTSVRLTGISADSAHLSKESESFATMPKIEINPGKWDFALSAELNGIAFSAQKTADIIGGQENAVSFVLKAVEDFGGFYFSYAFEGEADSVDIQLYDAGRTQQIESWHVAAKDFSETEENQRSFIVSRDAFDKDERLAKGQYYISFTFNIDGNDYPLGFDGCIFSIVSGQTTRKDFKYGELNETYSIEYIGAEDGEIASGDVCVTKYSKYGTSLHKLVKDGFVFAGWYESKDFSGDAVSSITEGSAGNKTLYARWIEPVLYVSADGNDTNSGFSSSDALKSISAAVDKICEVSAYQDWTINISGEISGVTQQINESLTADKAKSLLLTGSGIDDEGLPVDTICMNPAGSTNKTGRVLEINTPVPVKIENLRISGGKGVAGAGIYIHTGGVVRLTDGVLIENNRADSSQAGGGVYNEGTLYMYGTAIIGRKTTETATHDIHSNYAANGGAGIYNTGNLYFGYSDYTSEEENTPVELTGGVCYNFGWESAGGVTNAQTGTFVMNSGCVSYNISDYLESTTGAGVLNKGGTFIMEGGEVSYNRVYGNGAGIGNLKDSKLGTFIMKGGSIRGNRASSRYNGEGNGGAVYNTGNVYIYGSAVIGDENAAEMATETSCSNYAQANGGGIYNYFYSSSGYAGGCFLGYNEKGEEEELTGGIYYNYSKKELGSSYGGGGVCSASSTFKMNSGNIVNNATAGNGGAVYGGTTSQKQYFMLSGLVNIPGGNRGENDVYISANTSSNSDKIIIRDALSIPDENSKISLTVAKYDSKTQVLKSGRDSDIAELKNVTVEIKDVLSCFTVNEELRENGLRVKWTIGEDGKLIQGNIPTYTVKHLLQKVDESGYEEYASETLQGNVGEPTAASAKNTSVYAGFTAQEINQGVVAEDNSTVVCVYYDRKTVSLVLNLNGGQTTTALTDGKLIGLYGAAVNLDEPTKENYSFAGWDPALPETFPAESVEEAYVAQWTEKTVHYTVKHMQQNIEGDGYTEVTADTMSYEGNAGAQTEAEAKTYIGFSAQSVTQKTINEDESTVVEIYYNRNIVELTIDLSEGTTTTTLTEGKITGRYGATVAVADPTKAGMIFIGWNEEGGQLPATFTENGSYTAVYAENAANYKVKHYQQNVDGNGYTEITADLETKSGIVGNNTVAVAKTYDGFTAQTFSQTVITEDGNAVVEIYYNRNTITLTFDLDGGETTTTLEGGKLTGLYGAPVSLAALTKQNYRFVGWNPELPETFPAESPETAYTAQWRSVSVTVEVSTPDDSSVEISCSDIDNPEAKELSFVIANYKENSSYRWYLDGTEITEMNANDKFYISADSLTMYKEEFTPGTYIITLVSGAYSSSVTVVIN